MGRIGLSLLADTGIGNAPQQAFPQSAAYGSNYGKAVSVAVDPIGGIAATWYAADKMKGNVVIYPKGGQSDFLGGLAPSALFPGSSGAQGAFPNIAAVAVSAAGDLFVAEALQRTTGRVRVFPGGHLNFTSGYLARFTVANSDTFFFQPNALAVDRNSNALYVADYRTVWAVPNGGAGTPVQFGTGAGYAIPVNVVVDINSIVYILDLGIIGGGLLFRIPSSDPTNSTTVDSGFSGSYALAASHTTPDIFMTFYSEQKIFKYANGTFPNLLVGSNAIYVGTTSLDLSC